MAKTRPSTTTFSRFSLAAVLTLALVLSACTNMVDQQAYEDFCVEGVAAVYDCGEYVKVVTDEHSLWFDAAGHSQECPLTATADMNLGCQQLFKNDCAEALTCPAPTTVMSKAGLGELTACTERPEACTMDYAPVCGEQSNGSIKTYSNACTACSDEKVVGYVAGECGTTQISEETSPGECAEPRPQACTREYAPVCAELADGTTKTYGNACTACSDQAVVRYEDGACPSTTTPSATPDNDVRPAPTVMCQDPRPEGCTHIQQPVCAELQDGRRRTYDNKCLACHDPEVYSYTLGECPQQVCTLNEQDDGPCPAIYDPVCAKVGYNQRQTFASACEACKVPGVQSYEKGACQQTFTIATDAQIITPGELIQCTSEQRGATSCEPVYDLVCGVKRNGEQLTFGNACSACRNSDVVGYYQGFCTWRGTQQPVRASEVYVAE